MMVMIGSWTGAVSRVVVVVLLPAVIDIAAEPGR